MKKLALVILFFVALITVMRLVEVDAPRDNRPAPALVCRDAGAAPDPNIPTCEALRAVGAAYEKQVLPIFAAKCLMCHGVVAKIPLYAKVPPSSWLLKSDMEEAKEHMDMSFGFPFHGKDAKTPSEALSEIGEVVRDNEMPPAIYKIMHWNTSLTPEEAQTVLTWTNEGLGALK